MAEKVRLISLDYALGRLEMAENDCEENFETDISHVCIRRYYFMKHCKKLICFVLVLFTLISYSPAVFAANHPFTDVPSGCWYEEAVVYMHKNGYMSGISNTKFGPNNNMSRAMLVTFLHRLSGDPDPSATTPFKDVSSSQYYANAVAWAYKNNIVSGTSAYHFSPNASVSREQLVAILYRYANCKKLDTTARANLTKFSDYRKISSYALEPFQWAFSAGLISGVTSTSLSPSGLATRAQCATILYRFTLWANQSSSQPENDNSVPETEPTTPPISQNNGNKITLRVPKADITKYIQYPQKNDFGTFYDQAITLYNAIVSEDPQQTITLHFPVTWSKSLSESQRKEQMAEILRPFRDAYTVVFNHFLYFEFDTYTLDSNGIVVTTRPAMWKDRLIMRMGMQNPSVYYDANISAGLRNGMSEREAVTKIAEWICQQIKFGSEGDPVVALETGLGYCKAYAQIFYGMCQSAGFQCQYQTGCVTTNDESHSCSDTPGCHAWNKVLIDDTWYFVDVTWIDFDGTGVTNSEFFLADKLLKSQEIRYSMG